MTTSTITPDIVGVDNTERLLDTDLTPTELARVQSLETKLKMSDATVLEQKIIQGETLFRIQQERLYRSREPGERFTWEQYLQKFTPALTKNGKGYGLQAAALRQMLHLFHSKLLSPRATLGESIPMPTGTDQLIPLLGKSPVRGAAAGGGFDLDGDWDAVIAIWKGANSKQPNPNRQAVSDARSTFEKNQLRAGADPGRMLSDKQQASLDKANAARAASAPSAGSSAPTQEWAPEPQDFSPATPQPTVPAWELEKHDDSVDVGAECRRITQALNSAFKAVAELRGILYSQTNKYGSDYLNFLRQVDAGVYSLNNIDDQIEQLSDDIDFVAQLLTVEVGEGELARSTIDVASIPTKA